MHNIFPFELGKTAGDRLFHAYIQQHRAQLDQQYGDWCYTTYNGVTGQHKLFSWFEVDVTVLSPTEVRFTTFGMESFDTGGRGEQEHEIVHTYPAGVLDPYIAARRLRAAESEFERREAERERLAREMAIAAIHYELFGEGPCTPNACNI